MGSNDTRQGRLDRSRFELEFADDFDGADLSTTRWVDHYLPHWSTPDRSAARYVLSGACLELRIDADQAAWRPEDGEMRVSNIQTGTYSGPLGSRVGQHRHRPDLWVRTPQPTRRLWTPTAGLVEVTARASAEPACMLGIWLVGFEEDAPEESGEICIAELFGNAMRPYRSQVRLGIKAHHDPRLTTDMADLVLDLDATDLHTYAATWDSHATRFYVDDCLVREVEQAISYPQQLMIDQFEFPDTAERNDVSYPKTAEIDGVRGYRWR